LKFVEKEKKEKREREKKKKRREKKREKIRRADEKRREGRKRDGKRRERVGNKVMIINQKKICLRSTTGRRTGRCVDGCTSRRRGPWTRWLSLLGGRRGLVLGEFLFIYLSFFFLSFLDGGRGKVR